MLREIVSGDASVYASFAAVLRILLAQAGVALGVAGVSWLVSGPTAAYSALLGGAACVLPNAFLGARMLAFGAVGTARTMMRSAYFGEMGKLILTVLAFGAIFALVRPLHAGLVFAAFIACQSVMLFALIATNKTETNRILTRTEHGSRETLGG